MRSKKSFLFVLLFFIILLFVSCGGEKEYCTITFDSNGGSEVQSQKILKGEKANKPDEPMKEGYSFNGWFFEEEEWNFIGFSVTQNMALEAKWEINYYSITLENDDFKAGKITGAGTFRYGEERTIIAETNPGYTFIGWYDEKTLVSEKTSYSFCMPAKHLKYIARWTANNDTSYTVLHYKQNIDDTDYPSTPFEIEYLTGITNTMTNAKVKSYDGFVAKSFNQKIINGDGQTILQLYYERKNYSVSLRKNNDDAGSVNGDGIFKFEKEVTIVATTNPGYTFVGWYDGDELINELESYTFNMPSKNLIYEARWIVTPITTCMNIKEAGEITLLTEAYSIGQKITIVATTNPGYMFNGWYLNNELYEKNESFVHTISEEVFGFEARYTAIKYTIILDNRAESVSVTGVTSGNKYDFNSEISIKTLNIPNGCTIKWQRSDGKVYFGDVYSFKVPHDNITIIATISYYLKDDNKIYFGTYPQSLVEANSENGLLKYDEFDYSWISYKYYIESDQCDYMYYSEQSDYMYYKDVDIDDDGIFDYRGVYFSQYRHSDSAYNNSPIYQSENDYFINTIYWFSYDPIEWNILVESSGKALIISNLLLDSQEFYPSDTINRDEFEHNGGIGHANNYELSTIRQWLNDCFYNTAFNDFQKSIIKTTEVENGLESTTESGNGYICNNTNDKMFILSFKEASKTYYTTNEERKAKGSDYAKSQGLRVSKDSSNLGYSSWWLRSPSVYRVLHVSTDYGNDITSKGPTCNSFGIRPACWINL